MTSATPGHRYSTAEPDAAARVPPPRTPSMAVGDVEEFTPAFDEVDAVTTARVREAATRHAAAAKLFEEGQFEQAVPLFEQALASCRSTLGGEHPDTLTVAGNLGVAYIAAGNRRKGLKVIKDNISARTRILGDDHPDTMTARNAFAVAHRLVGEADTAVSLSKQVVIQRSRALGSAHPDTLTSRMGLALALAAAGDAGSAQRILVSTLKDAQDTLGQEHDYMLALIECGESNGLLRREI